MKTKLSLTLGALVALTTAALAQTVTVLESFEDNIDGAVATNERATFSSYTKEGAADTKVTHGEKALKVNIKDDLGWGNDGTITLSAEASTLVKDAWATRQEARYILAYDIEFPSEGINWGNFIGRINDWDYAQLEAGGAVNRTMTFPLDLVTTDLSAVESITITVIDQYGPADGTTELDVFVDNIRLIDTYAPGAVPVITLLNGFETEDDLAKLINVDGEERYTSSLHKKAGADDIAVTEGESSLKVEFDRTGQWVRDFTIPFKGTIMDTIAALPQEGRSRYTLRMDVIFGVTAAGWQNFIPREAGGAALNFAMHRSGGDQHVRTLSLPLDTVALTPGDPANPDDPNPGLSFVNQGGWQEADFVMHYDNIRVIDTGNVPLAIQDLAFGDDGNLSISWQSSASQAYAIDMSTDLQAWTEMQGGVEGDGESTTFSLGEGPFTGKEFFRIRVDGFAAPLKEDFENGIGEWTVGRKEINSADIDWEVGEVTSGPGAANSGTMAAGTNLAGNATSVSHVFLRSPLVDLTQAASPPTMSFSQYIEAEGVYAARIVILNSAGVVLEEPGEGDPGYFTQNTDGWEDTTFEVPAFGQKVFIEFEFLLQGEGPGWYVDDIRVDLPE
ncbi:MAG: hypothetical protein AAF514_00550 [Verrucomicrobiota bacterium]